MNEWYLPITILPSVGFFIMATANISNALSGEISMLIESQKECNQKIALKKIDQLQVLTRSAVFQYISAALLCLAGLIAGLQANFAVEVGMYVALLVCLGIGGILIGLFYLIVYAFRAVGIKRDQFYSNLDK